MLNEQQKKVLKSTGILFGMFLVVCAILVTMILVSKSFWRNGLKNTIQDALNASYPETYTVGNFVELNSGFSTNAAFYECRSSSNSHMHVVIVKVPTISGPAPAVFLINGKSAQFACWALDNGNVSKVVDPKFTSGTISYWQERLPLILEKAGNENE